ncbi:MAG: hypothetical protein IRZ00_01665 [Gemmatimonadetes bacterium]|nr:hypothetical protein [Gemmatimonadota bacterium]
MSAMRGEQDVVVAASAGPVARGRILGVADDGALMVGCDADGTEPVPCDVLRTGRAPVELAAGDVVLVLLPLGGEPRGVILGRVEPYGAATEAAGGDAPDELVLEARRNLTLRCGEGSITLREDGKVLIKGKDLVSHAQRVNRIKGGAVSIN